MKCLENFYKSEELDLEIYVSNLINNLDPIEIIGSYDFDRIKGNVYVENSELCKGKKP